MALSFEPSGVWNFACALIVTRCSPGDCQMPFVIGRGFAKVQIQTCPSPDSLWSYLSSDSRENYAQLLNRLECLDKLLHTHWYWQDLAQEIENRSRLWRAPNSEKVKMALSLKSSGTLLWNFACALILTRCSPRDHQMPIVIGRGFAEVQIQKMPLSLEPFGICW